MANKTDKLNVFLANLAVLNIKVHNLHWNVVGLQFPLIHKMTEKIYKMLRAGKSEQKAEFALDVIFEISPDELLVPPYVDQGLMWLQDYLHPED